MQYRKFLDLTEDEIRFILMEVFAPVKIENIKKNPEWDEITADITTTDEEVLLKYKELAWVDCIVVYIGLPE